MTHPIAAFLLAAGCGAALTISAARAEDVHWRKSYADARKEAASKDKLLFLEFGAEHCHWCRRLDAETLRDPVVIGLLNEQFVAYRVDVQRDVRLTEALNIQSYPTLVFAGPDGKILGTQEGYVEAARFRDQLRRAAALNTVPEPMAHDYDEAAKAIAAADYSRAIALLKDVIHDGKDRPVQRKARTLLLEIEDQAAERLTSARRLADQGLTGEAIATATELTRVYAGSKPAKDAVPLLATWTASLEAPAESRARRAKELLAQARQEYRAQRFGSCLDHCETISAQYADLNENAAAGQLAAEIKNNPEWMRQACDQLGERLALHYLTLAESHIRKGQSRQAAGCLERVIQMFPGTRQAEAAQARLTQVLADPSK